ncbi:MAG: GAF domain-containing protein [Chloroflexota bacterium]
MIVAPDWTTLKGIAAGLDAPDPIGRRKALQHLLETVTESLPDVHAVRLYDIEKQTIIVRAATDLEEMAVFPLSDYPVIQNLFEQGEILWQPEQQQWMAPLIAADEPVGLLEVLVEELDEDWLTWLSLIAGQLAPALGLQQMANRPIPTETGTVNAPTSQEQVARLVKATRMLAASEDYDEAATATMYIADERVVSVMLSVFDQPLDTNETGTDGVTNNRRYVAAVATLRSAELVEQNESLAGMPELSYIKDIRNQIPITLSNIQTDAGYLTQWMRQRVADLEARGVAVFAMAAADQIVGTIELFYNEAVTLTERDISLYTTLANQVATTILSKRLLQRSLQAQAFASQLVTTNKSLAVAESYEEMARAVLDDAPDSVEGVAIALFNRPFTLMGSPASLRTQSVITREGGISEERFADGVSASDDARVTYFLHEFLEGRMMLLWNIQRPRKPVLAESLVEYLRGFEVDQITAFGLNVRNSLRGLVVFAGDATLRDAGPQYDGLRAIADQLAAVIENRILLQQTSDALDLIQSQYETSNRVFRTDDLSEILRAVYDFAGGMYERAELVWQDAIGSTYRLAEVSSEGNREMKVAVEMSDYPASGTLSVLEALEVRDVSEDAFIDDDERRRLLNAGVKALVILPILENFALAGLIMLTNSKPTRVAPDRLRAMRSLTDQVGVVLQNRNLLQSMELNLSEIQVLYEANRSMLRTQDIMDVLRVLRNNLARDVTTICQLGIIYDVRDRNRIVEVELDYEIHKGEERIIRESLASSDRDRRDTYNFLRGIQETVLFSPNGSTVPGNPIILVRDRYTVESFATLVIKERGQTAALIYLLFDQPKPFVESTRRLYEAISDQVAIAIDNQKLLRESQIAASKLSEQVKALQTISALAVELSNIKDESILLDTSSRALVEALRVDHCGVVLFNEDLQNGVVVSEYPEGEYKGATVTTKDNPILNEDHNLSDPFVSQDVPTDERMTLEMRNVFSRARIRSVIIIPLIGQSGELIGSVGLDVFGEPRAFDETEIQTAQTIAAQMAVGLQNVRLLRDAQSRAEQLQHISDFSSITQSTLDINELIETTLANVPRLMDVAHMTVTLYDDAEDALLLAGGWQENSGFRTTLETGERVSRRGTTTGHVFASGEHLYIPNYQSGSRLHYPHSRTINTLLAIPLRNQGRAIGVITVGAYRTSAYTDTDIAVFQQLVNQMAVAMDNARTYTQGQQLARNKVLANDIALKLQRQGNIEEMVNLTMTEVGRAIGAKRGRLRLKSDLRQNPENDILNGPRPSDEPAE